METGVTGGDPKASTTILVGIIGTVLLLAIVLFAAALYYHAEDAQAARKVYARPPAHEVSALKSEQLEKLHAYRWVNEQERIVAIPIQRAIELTVRDLKSGQDPARIVKRGSGPNPASQPTGSEP